MKSARTIIIFIIFIQIGFAQWEKTNDPIQHPKVDSYSNNDMENNKKQKAMIDWSNGWLEFEGTAYVTEGMAGNFAKAQTRAERTARMIAIADMADFVLNLMVMGGTEYEHEELERDKLTAIVEGTIDKRHKVLFKDKGLTEMTIPGKGRETYAWGRYVIGLQMYGEGPGERIINTIIQQDKSGYKNDGYSVFLPKEKKQEPANFTGLVVDARGMDLSPSMSPGIFVDGANKQQLYGAMTIMSTAASKFGIVSYLRNLDEATSCDRVVMSGKASPLVVKAVRIGGKNNQNVFISKKDATRIFNANSVSPFLDECRVVFLVD